MIEFLLVVLGKKEWETNWDVKVVKNIKKK